MTKGRLKGALAGYAALALISIAVLEGRFLGFIMILFAALALKSWLSYKSELLSDSETPKAESDENHAKRG